MVILNVTRISPKLSSCFPFKVPYSISMTHLSHPTRRETKQTLPQLQPEVQLWWLQPCKSSLVMQRNWLWGEQVFSFSEMGWAMKLSISLWHTARCSCCRAKCAASSGLKIFSPVCKQIKGNKRLPSVKCFKRQSRIWIAHKVGRRKLKASAPVSAEGTLHI